MQKLNKKLKKVVIFKKIDYNHPIKFSTIKNIVEDNDIITAGYDEGFYFENDSVDPHFFIEITREQLETDEEYDKRIEEDEKNKKFFKKRRFETYLKLKKEFE